MKRIYCDVDTQVDFMMPNGALYVPDAEKLIPTIRSLLDKAVTDREGLLVGSLDAHDYRSSEFVENGGPFPRHCVRGTLGQLKVPDLQIDRMAIVSKGDAFALDRMQLSAIQEFDGAQGLYFEKDQFSLFDNSGAEDSILDWLGRVARTNASQVQVVVFGVATDYCVKAAALGFKKLGFPVAVVRDAIAAVTPEGNETAFKEFWDSGIETIFAETIR